MRRGGVAYVVDGLGASILGNLPQTEADQRHLLARGQSDSLLTHCD